MSAPESAGTEGWLALEPIKHNGKHYPQHAVLSRDELDDASAEQLILAGVIAVAEWVDERPAKTKKPSKPAKASQA